MRNLTGVWGNFMRWVGFVCLTIGIVTAALDVTFDSFATIYWFLIAIFCFIIVVCTEVVLTREALLSKKEK
jgi:hypothetical protein